MIFQRFSFCSTIINYILKNATANFLQTLFKTCKEIFSKHPTPVCYKLTLQSACDHLKPFWMFEETLSISHENPAEIYDAKMLLISKKLNVSCKKFPQMLSTFIPKIYRCEAKYISLFGQKLLAKEFEFLTENVGDLWLRSVEIFYDDGTNLPLEEIMKMVLNVQVVSIIHFFCTPQTAEILSTIPFKHKICSLHFWSVYTKFDPHAFAAFIEKNGAEKSQFVIGGSEFNDDTVSRDNFNQIIQETINNKWKDSEKPTFEFEDDIWD